MTEQDAPNYATSTWAGKEKFDCLLCRHSQWTKPKIQEHINRKHGVPSVPQATETIPPESPEFIEDETAAEPEEEEAT